ncbi:MAG: gamma-glutamyltransferase family protein [Burkholderiaceae bacterium]|nr:gamma-glutamyltransferase family protein [Burkholderiaceae bacterium]
MRLRRRAGAMVAPLAAALLLGACTGLPQPADPPALPPPALAAAAKPPPAIPAAPERASGWRAGLQPVQAAQHMVVTAHPLASEVGLATLRAGGSAADAALAVQLVLGLVEPQSSGLGGGAFIVHVDAAGRVQTWDGRETAPAAALPDDLRWISADDRRTPLPDVRASGRSMGVPGALRALEALHAQHGRLPWAQAFGPAIGLAERGFPVPQRLADAIATHRTQLLRDPDAAALFLHPDGSPRAAGSGLRNPAYAATLRTLAAEGAGAFYRGPIADDIVAEAQRAQAGPAAPGPLTPGRMTAADLAGYRAVERAPVCSAYRQWEVCGMGPPSSGGIAVGQVLGLLAAAPPASSGPEAVHRLVEALRLAFADRNRYVADTDFVPLPGQGAATLLDPAYLRSRAALIQPDRSLGVAPAGRFDVQARGMHAGVEHGTSHVSIVDRWGNAVAMTTTVEASLGAWRVVRGFVLNNQLTDFSAQPADADGPVANRLQGGKRPRSSMAPTLVFDRASDGTRGALRAVTGSPGGAAIIAFVAQTLVALKEGRLDAQAATEMPRVGAFNTPATVLERDHPDSAALDTLEVALRARGHRVVRAPMTSGVATILRVPGGWQGGADPRREGQALGD